MNTKREKIVKSLIAVLLYTKDHQPTKDETPFSGEDADTYLSMWERGIWKIEEALSWWIYAGLMAKDAANLTEEDLEKYGSMGEADGIYELPIEQDESSA